MKKLSNTEAELKNSVAYKRRVYLILNFAFCEGNLKEQSKPQLIEAATGGVL